ncbi:unnamed protein product, partial [Vitis vinifera]
MDDCNAGITPTQSHKLLSFHLCFMISIFFFLIFPSATSLSFNFTTFEPNNGQISFEGEARYSSYDGIQLTRNQQDKTMGHSWGRAIYKEQLYLWDRTSRNLTDFATNFSFVINSLNRSVHADGITFFLNGTQLPSGKFGENLGLTNNVTNTTVIRFVAVEFDTFCNKAKRDPVSDHVGIDINSTISVKTVNWSSNIEEGKLNHVSIRYTSGSQNLSVVLITEFMDDKTTSQSLSYKVDLREYLPEFVTIGFSGATGNSFQIHNIYSWNFSSTLQPPNPVEPGDGKKTGFVVGLSVGVVVVVCGLGLVWHHLRKKRNSGGEENGTDSDLVMDEDFEKGTGPRKFSFDELALATSNFAEEEKLGEGGFVSRGSKQGMKEYAAEVKIISIKLLLAWPLPKEKQVRLVEWVWHLYGVGKLVDAADPRLSNDFDEEQMERLMIVGLWCAHPDCDLRPSIRQAINVLNSEASLPLLPLKMPVPMYCSPPVLQTISRGAPISESSHTQYSDFSNSTTSS